MQARNYQRELDAIIADLEKEGRVPRLLLHSCCAPCSSYVLEYLSRYFEITAYYYNPNITDEEEYRKRADELARLIREMEFIHPVTYREGPFEGERFLKAVRGHENAKEGTSRCEICFRLRLFEAARAAKEGWRDKAGRTVHPGGFDYFTTTLTISPLKNAAVLNLVGEEAGRQYGVPFLPCDFKKKGGYARSVELSAKYGLYRQNYCGCVFSKR